MSHCLRGLRNLGCLTASEGRQNTLVLGASAKASSFTVVRNQGCLTFFNRFETLRSFSPSLTTANAIDGAVSFTNKLQIMKRSAFSPNNRFKTPILPNSRHMSYRSSDFSTAIDGAAAVKRQRLIFWIGISIIFGAGWTYDHTFCGHEENESKEGAESVAWKLD